uniref:Pyruvate kinase n=1 Tax=Lotharella globosa TaxID=91324 RepID=A0A7S4DWE2_9EUKA|mmetsp:Transcript_20748/g.41925  ORF Transcript_20748/g.41925 Transcript_20748/m.41925 type:complete len:488 (+) Transcript_20748:70-1533(+)
MISQPLLPRSSPLRRRHSRHRKRAAIVVPALVAAAMLGVAMWQGRHLGLGVKSHDNEDKSNMNNNAAYDRVAKHERYDRSAADSTGTTPCRLRGGALELEKVVSDQLQIYGKESANEFTYNPLTKKTKVIATLGPACSDIESLKALLRAGANIFRLNSSHRRPGQFEKVVKLIRQASAEAGIPVQILGDLQGPKFRVAEVGGEGHVMLQEGEVVSFGIRKDDNDVIVPGRIVMKPTKEQTALLKGLSNGMKLLINDGAMELQVIERVSEEEVKAKVVVGGKLTARKGVNVPQLQIECSALTAKDIDDANFLLSCDPPIDYVALSFVQKKQDVEDFIELMDKAGIPKNKRPKIIPKIEKPQALENVDGILEIADGLMVARGDLGVECSIERVPFAQKLLIRKANLQKKFVIVATQMLESMNDNAAPTRAEVSDVANAVFDGTNAVMTSAETSTGKFPSRTIEQMSRIVTEAEKMLPKLAQLGSTKKSE